MIFTEGQLKAWETYERVRKGGKFNMYDTRARRATKLSSEKYSFVKKHYFELEAVVEAVKKKGQEK